MNTPLTHPMLNASYASSATAIFGGRPVVAIGVMVEGRPCSILLDFTSVGAVQEMSDALALAKDWLDKTGGSNRPLPTQ